MECCGTAWIPRDFPFALALGAAQYTTRQGLLHYKLITMSIPHLGKPSRTATYAVPPNHLEFIVCFHASSVQLMLPC